MLLTPLHHRLSAVGCLGHLMSHDSHMSATATGVVVHAKAGQQAEDAGRGAVLCACRRQCMRCTRLPLNAPNVLSAAPANSQRSHCHGPLPASWCRAEPDTAEALGGGPDNEPQPAPGLASRSHGSRPLPPPAPCRRLSCAPLQLTGQVLTETLKGGTEHQLQHASADPQPLGGKAGQLWQQVHEWVGHRWAACRHRLAHAAPAGSEPGRS